MQDAIDIVRASLEASMRPDPDLAASYMADDVFITFTGGRRMNAIHDVTAFNASRYAWVKKDFGPMEAVDNGDHVVVYCTGTLYGAWPDGRSFSGNRYLDRYEVRDGKITRMDVWNDSAEWILEPGINRD